MQFLSFFIQKPFRDAVFAHQLNGEFLLTNNIYLIIYLHFLSILRVNHPILLKIQTTSFLIALIKFLFRQVFMLFRYPFPSGLQF